MVLNEPGGQWRQGKCPWVRGNHQSPQDQCSSLKLVLEVLRRAGETSRAIRREGTSRGAREDKKRVGGQKSELGSRPRKRVFETSESRAFRDFPARHVLPAH